MSDEVFVDTETTGLDLREDQVWEVFACRRGKDGIREMHWFVDHDYRLRERMPEPFRSDLRARYDLTRSVDQATFAKEFYEFTYGAHFIGCVPDFDIYRIERILHRSGLKPGWHYHPIDVENLAVGFLAALGRKVALPWNSDEISAVLGVTPPPPGIRHTAQGDVYWAMALYDKVMGR